MIEFSHISKIYPGLTALSDISFEIEEGEFSFFVGPSGSGKSTIIKLLIKEEEPTEGNIYFYETDLSKIKGSQIAQLRREISVVFQDFKLLPQKSVFENVAFGLEVAGRTAGDINETVPYVLNLVELSERAESFPDELSGGEKQKIAIARAIANNPKVLIADEPTGNLDPESSWEIIDLLDKINKWGTTVIMATHGTDIVNSLGKRVIHLEGGSIISDNKKGSYPSRITKLNKTKTKSNPIKLKKKIVKKSELINKNKSIVNQENRKAKEALHKQKKSKKASGEKEFVISFTTNPKIPPKKTNKKKILKEDVVNITKLKLSKKIEDRLIKAGITTIKGLKEQDITKLAGIKGIQKEDIDQINKVLENFC